MKIGIIDYGSGNFASVYNAVRVLTSDIETVRCASDFEKVSHIILPGVGTFLYTMERMHDLGLLAPLKEHVLLHKKPYLGICVGMQILGENGYEFGAHRGLGWIPSNVSLLENRRLPHMGWNEIEIEEELEILQGIENKSTFYFVHSYAMETPLKRDNVKVAFTDYSQKFVSVIQKDNIHGVQFHPEKSQEEGLKLLQNFINIER